MSGQLTAETLTEFFAPLEEDCGIDPGELAEAFLAWSKFAAHNEAIRRETLLAAADAYGPEGTDATDWLRDRAEAAS